MHWENQKIRVTHFITMFALFPFGLEPNPQHLQGMLADLKSFIARKKIVSVCGDGC